jgi:uncharacterized BrkB/YihY/UPF0761 family membrane protein
MNFTPREKKLLERLRKEERRWPKVRWFILVVGAFYTILTFCFGIMLYSSFHAETLIPVERREPLDSTTLLGILFFWTIFWAGLLNAVGRFTIAFWKWRGDPYRALLLKLVDERAS